MLHPHEVMILMKILANVYPNQEYFASAIAEDFQKLRLLLAFKQGITLKLTGFRSKFQEMPRLIVS